MDPLETTGDFGPWNPGLTSEIPREFLPLSTMFRPECVSTPIKEAYELSDFCGLPANQIVAFRPERLIVHELLIRVTADLAVPDGPNYGDLGINLRSMTATILEKYITPEMTPLVAVYDDLRRDAAQLIERELTSYFAAEAKPVRASAKKKSWLDRLLGRSASPARAPTADRTQRQTDAISGWQNRANANEEPFEAACLAALVKVAYAIIAHRGRLMGEPAAITGIAVNLVGNNYGSRRLGEAIEPSFQRAAEAENYRVLKAQDKPVVMNVKGASAAGKSTIRGRQRQLADQLGIPWDDFAVISPDYWRKFLLDYDSLGDGYKYAAMLTGHELEIIDKKLDRYMAGKAARGAMSHLLIDRFRFDSFTVEAGRAVDSTLLTRFGELVFMFFIITPPEATVERAWKRGLSTGRYKAVDDLLYHNIEAYAGIAQLFFSWASATKKRVHYEFLDNSVAEGERPRTVAFGWNGSMTILDIKLMLDIERFKKIDINARQPEDVYDRDRMSADQNTGFLKQCKDHIPVINFADYQSSRIYARLQNGVWTWRDDAQIAKFIDDPDTRAGLEAVGWSSTENAGDLSAAPDNLESEKTYLLGEWRPDS
jgi:hypothetical protein